MLVAPFTMREKVEYEVSGGVINKFLSAFDPAKDLVVASLAGKIADQVFERVTRPLNIIVRTIGGQACDEVTNDENHEIFTAAQ